MKNKLVALFLDFLLSCFEDSKQLIFSKIQIDGSTIEGQITMVKLEFDQEVTFTANPVDRRGKAAHIETGSAEWTVTAVDSTGADVSDAVEIEVSKDNELSATVYAGDQECVATVTLRADGDPHGEVAPLIATATVVIDAPNVVAFSLEAGDATDTDGLPAKAAPAVESAPEVAPAEASAQPNQEPNETDNPPPPPVDKNTPPETPGAPAPEPTQPEAPAPDESAPVEASASTETAPPADNGNGGITLTGADNAPPAPTENDPVG